MVRLQFAGPFASDIFAIMGMKLDAKDASAYEALDRLLFREWDPIGVAAMDGPDDEYRAYLPGFWDLIKAGTPEAQVAEYLGTIERELMGVATSHAHRLDVARKATALLAAWHMQIRA